MRSVEGSPRCAGDALVLRRRTTDEAVGMLVRSFPAVASFEVKGGDGETAALTDEALRAVIK